MGDSRSVSIRSCIRSCIRAFVHSCISVSVLSATASPSRRRPLNASRFSRPSIARRGTIHPRPSPRATDPPGRGTAAPARAATLPQVNGNVVTTTLNGRVVSGVDGHAAKPGDRVAHRRHADCRGGGVGAAHSGPGQCCRRATRLGRDAASDRDVDRRRLSQHHRGAPRDRRQRTCARRGSRALRPRQSARAAGAGQPAERVARAAAGVDRRGDCRGGVACAVQGPGGLGRAARRDRRRRRRGRASLRAAGRCGRSGESAQ
jgi:hypothetical protein